MAIATLTLLLTSSAFGATRTWTGTSSGLWSAAANWGGTAPVPGDDLVFPAGASNLSNTNDFGAGTAFSSITISGAGYVLGGAAVNLGAGGIGSSLGGTISVDLTPTAAEMWTVSSGTLTISGNVNLNGQTLTLNSAGGNGNITGVISGSGTIVKIGGGGSGGVDWQLSGSNTFSGQIQVNNGRLVANNANAFGVSDNTLANGIITNGGTVTFGSFTFAPEYIQVNQAGNAGNGALQAVGNPVETGTIELGTAVLMNVVAPASLTFNGVVTGSGTFNMGGNGVYILANAGNNFTGGVQWNGGLATLTLGNDNVLPSTVSLVLPVAASTFNVNSRTQTIVSLSGAGTVNLGSGSGGTLTLTNPTGTMSGPIGGIGTIIQTGGNVTYSGANTYAGSYSHLNGATTIGGGTLPANFTQANGSTAISGNATMGAVTINGGSISPTSGTTGNLGLAAAATYNEAINGPATFGVLHVNGAVNLNGATLTLSGSGAGVAPGNTFTIIDNDGIDPVVGNFAGLANGATITGGPGGLNYVITYNGGSGNDVVLTAAATTPIPMLDGRALAALALLLCAIAAVVLRR
jgi:autotransporter-associated beta strand protein